MASRTTVRRASFFPADNVSYAIVGVDGKAKPIFQENLLAQRLLKQGKLSPLWINQWYAPYISPFLGYWSDVKVIGNGVPTVGKALAAGRIMGSGSPAALTYIAVGTGTNAFAAGDTTLQTETATSGLSRAAATVSLVTTSVTNDTAQATLTYTVSGTVAVTESGMFNAASTGTLGCRQTFSAINVVSGDSLAVTWKIQFS